ncbi:glycosyl transferase [Pectobacterium betavasculorum]|uniref:glycosyltransferase family 2 protein n=1 Tax=Pectobacterium betavasculorum TaxID=55207 RepID=UPI000689A604|nr:hypothetical protein [Pectobacterium betavasculorum]
MEKIKINAIIVLYNCNMEDSVTVNSIFKANLDNIELKLLIWNNGNILLNEKDVSNFIEKCQQKKISTDVYQDTRNLSLSKIYNYFIAKSDYNYISVLDQDTSVNNDFFLNIKENANYEIICPEIYLSNKENIKSSPIYNTPDESVDFIEAGDFNANAMFTCASGLSFSSVLIKKIADYYGYIFNESYAFYWADHDLLERLTAFDYVKGKCVGKMYHNMSGVGQDFSRMQESAKLEHGLGKILRRINKQNKPGSLRNIIYAIKYTLKAKCSISSALKIVQCAIQKQHPRSRFNIDKNSKATHNYSTDS